jgi:pyridoxine 5-phosphate synthase
MQHTKTPVQLGFNIDHIATLRQARLTRYPSPIEAALVAETAGADQITLHLREDRRHIQEDDVRMLKRLLKTRMNFEMAATPEMVEFALSIQPEEVCLVPEKREELTTEGGLDVLKHWNVIERSIQTLREQHIPVSLFIDPNLKQIEAAKETGVQIIEIHTGAYADAKTEAQQFEELLRLREAVEFGIHIGVQVNVGHGLTYHNTAAVAAIPGISVFNIGHAIVAQALFVGLTEAIRSMKALILASS